jgi:hypothetical protein
MGGFGLPFLSKTKMKKHDYLSEFRFDLHITGATNGALVEYPEVGSGNVVMMHSAVCGTKEAILALISKKLDDFYKD